MPTDSEKGTYEVLSPWAEADPVPLRGIMPGIPDLTGKKIGLFYNSKRAASPTSHVLEKELKHRFPSLEISYYKYSAVNVPEIETPNRSVFEDWLKGLDAVVLTYGD
jgi:hypothetical protein